ncbi:MAG: rRNA adenine N-6-methyltransferase family protein, partial [Pseudomonadota bacterium]
PPPKVTSSIVHLVPRPEPEKVSLKALETVTRHAFGQRRKMLRQSLKALDLTETGGSVEALLQSANIAPERRAETLSVQEFEILARQLHAMRTRSAANRPT